MNADKIDSTTLLKHDPKYGVLICLKCRYAIQRSALDTHLLRHKIYREERKRLLASTSHLNMLQPDEVPVPPPTSPAINYLSKFPGLRCTVSGCGHLTVSTKRMQLHWKQSPDHAAPTTVLSSLASDVTLQTFFRGNKLRYFEVESTHAAAASSTGSNDGGHNSPSTHDVRSQHVDSVFENPLPALSRGQPTHPPDLAKEFDMHLLTYFHHFTTSTGYTLPFSDNSPLRQHYWQEAVVAKALQCTRLMHGLLALSACHMATLADDPAAKELHQENEAKYASVFYSQIETTALDQVAEQMYVHVRYLLHMAQLALYGVSQAKANDIAKQRSVVVSLRDGLSLERIGSNSPQCIGVKGAATSSGSHDDTTEHAIIDGLQTLPSRMAELLGRPKNVGEALIIIKSIESLTEACNDPVAHDDIVACWGTAAAWLSDVSGRFHEMVDEMDPVALLVMAYWSAIMVARVERQGRWFLEGVARAAVLQVAEKLVADKHPLLPLILDFESL
jgi:hypothetical protein